MRCGPAVSAVAVGQVTEPGEAAATRDAVSAPARGQVAIDTGSAGVWDTIADNQFLDIARQIVDTQGAPASRIHADRGCRKGAGLNSVGRIWIKSVAPRVFSIVATTCGVFPFSLGGQAEPPAQSSGKPTRVHAGRCFIDRPHRVVGQLMRV